MADKRKKREVGTYRRNFIKTIFGFLGLPFLGKASTSGEWKNDNANSSQIHKILNVDIMKQSPGFSNLMNFSLVQALFGRRARRFGLGMEIPSGPLAYKSNKDPVPLSETEKMLLVAAATGVSGWNFGVPFGPRTPQTHAEFTVRFTGRTAPTAAGIGTPVVFFTDDSGCYCTNTRDVQPRKMIEIDEHANPLDHIVSVCRENTIRIRDSRIDLPSAPPHILPPNLWWVNKPGSTLFILSGDATEVCLGIMALMMRHGVMLVDHDTGENAGNLEPFIRSGLLDPEKRFPISELHHDVIQCVSIETAIMGHNIVLMLQALGLGGLFFNGLDDLSVLGANASEGIKGLGFRFVEDKNWITPNPVGLPGVYEGLCPPNYPDMYAAVKAFVNRKFGKGGAYDPEVQGSWKESASVKQTVEPYSDEFVECMSEVAQYIFNKYGKFPGTRSSIMVPSFVQAHHIDTDFYDKYYKEGAYLQTHSEHFEHWH
ncbi:MAG TPA: hypothetical protein PKC30_04470 [Saprospiraceae bacterium]|nr:hypothetical protein [Saprospiraceae bacterium]